MEDERPKLRWFRFSLRTLLVAVLVLSVPLSWLAVKLEKARQQRNAWVALESLGAYMLYDWGDDWGRLPSTISNPFSPEATKALQPDSSWLRDVFGNDFFDRVESVSLLNCKVTDADLEHVKGLPHLRHLSLDSPEITDAGLEHIAGLTSLEDLWLKNAQITDAGLEHLVGLTNLKRLKLTNTQITGTGLTHLAGLTNLELLTIHHTRVTDAGLTHLEGLTKLEELWLPIQVTPDGERKLQNSLPHCKIY